jgi:hypothetical protein
VRDFTWQVFTQTGDIEAYLLYKEVHHFGASELGTDIASEEEEEGHIGDED